MKSLWFFGPLLLSAACARKPAQATSTSPDPIVRRGVEPVPLSDVAEALKYWEALREAIPAQLSDTASLPQSRARDAQLCRPAEGFDFEPDALIIAFAEDVKLERQRAVLEQVHARAIRGAPSGYLVLLRPTGRCDAMEVAKLLKTLPGVTHVVLYNHISIGIGDSS